MHQWTWWLILIDSALEIMAVLTLVLYLSHVNFVYVDHNNSSGCIMCHFHVVPSAIERYLDVVYQNKIVIRSESTVNYSHHKGCCALIISTHYLHYSDSSCSQRNFEVSFKWVKPSSVIVNKPHFASRVSGTSDLKR